MKKIFFCLVFAFSVLDLRSDTNTVDLSQVTQLLSELRNTQVLYNRIFDEWWQGLFDDLYPDLTDQWLDPISTFIGGIVTHTGQYLPYLTDIHEWLGWIVEENGYLYNQESFLYFIKLYLSQILDQLGNFTNVSTGTYVTKLDLLRELISGFKTDNINNLVAILDALVNNFPRVLDMQSMIYDNLGVFGDDIMDIISKLTSLLERTEDYTDDYAANSEDIYDRMGDILNAIEALSLTTGAPGWVDDAQESIDGVRDVVQAFHQDYSQNFGEYLQPFFDDYNNQKEVSLYFPAFHVWEDYIVDNNSGVQTNVNLRAAPMPARNPAGIFNQLRDFLDLRINQGASDTKSLILITRYLYSAEQERQETRSAVESSINDTLSGSKIAELRDAYNYDSDFEHIQFDQEKRERYFDYSPIFGQMSEQTLNTIDLGSVPLKLSTGLSGNPQVGLDQDYHIEVDIKGLQPFLDFSRRVFAAVYYFLIFLLVWVIYRYVGRYIWRIVMSVSKVFES